ncbi:MAG: hypothetical protein M1821_004663 [Bathelium mastoideum]|nr:MAG: hypothetical protein M1821_004663 [Bathelium mastoideum]
MRDSKTIQERANEKKRKTQRRKRSRGILKKAYELGRLPLVEIAIAIYYSEENRYFTYQSSGFESWPSAEEITEHTSEKRLCEWYESSNAEKTSSIQISRRVRIADSKRKAEAESHGILRDPPMFNLSVFHDTFNGGLNETSASPDSGWDRFGLERSQQSGGNSFS